MTVRDLLDKLQTLQPLALPCPEAEITGGYAGDLLSFVMGNGEEGQVWVTIMSNVNVIAVATLCDFALVILAQNVTLEESVLETAKEKGINVCTSSLTAFELCRKVGEVIS